MPQSPRTANEAVLPVCKPCCKDWRKISTCCGRPKNSSALTGKFGWGSMSALQNHAKITKVAIRSEERRVGKECRSRWMSEHCKKKRTRKSDRAKRNATKMQSRETSVDEART